MVQSTVAFNNSAAVEIRNQPLAPLKNKNTDRFLSLVSLKKSVGHKGKFGHEFMEFEFSSSGKLRYANNSNYKNDTMIRKEVTVSQAVLDEVRRIIQEADIIA